MIDFDVISNIIGTGETEAATIKDHFGNIGKKQITMLTRKESLYGFRFLMSGIGDVFSQTCFVYISTQNGLNPNIPHGWKGLISEQTEHRTPLGQVEVVCVYIAGA